MQAHSVWYAGCLVSGQRKRARGASTLCEVSNGGSMYRALRAETEANQVPVQYHTKRRGETVQARVVGVV